VQLDARNAAAPQRDWQPEEVERVWAQLEARQHHVARPDVELHALRVEAVGAHVRAEHALQEAGEPALEQRHCFRSRLTSQN